MREKVNKFASASFGGAIIKMDKVEADDKEEKKSKKRGMQSCIPDRLDLHNLRYARIAF